jgi:hypothetical protein
MVDGIRHGAPWQKGRECIAFALLHGERKSIPGQEGNSNRHTLVVQMLQYPGFPDYRLRTAFLLEDIGVPCRRFETQNMTRTGLIARGRKRDDLCRDKAPMVQQRVWK